ncbi:MAG: hypothetical protein M0D53_02030 [Flavobacterium sp. JAD_PAG50586_2]|nr:MAG: hypothetical protein M0D53_02030 [Flavobacterium sp. JAD_PAG50586_2]
MMRDKKKSEEADCDQTPLHMAISCETAVNELKKIYWYEKQLLIAIPMLLSGATTLELVESLTVLSNHTTAHIKLLESEFPGISRI